MRIYIAGHLQDPPDNYPYQQLIRHRLRSFFEKPKISEYSDYYGSRNFFLDSGAFSAWSRGVSIDIHQYAKFICENRENISIFANLDVIGNARDCWRNQKVLESYGISPIPVFHRFDDFRYLDKCVREYPYFAIGGMAKSTTRARQFFFDSVFHRIEKLNPSTFPKIHGFGMTNVRLILRYPWYSVDSTSWLMCAITGGIQIPIIRNGAVCLKTPPIVLHYSHLHGNSKKLHKTQKEQILRYLAELGTDIDEKSPLSIFNSAQGRQYANIAYFNRLEDAINSQTTTKKQIQSSFFNL